MVGELDIATVGRARGVLRRAQDDAEEVICDLGDVSFIDVFGLHLLLDASAHARNTGARLILVHSPPFIHRVLGALGLQGELEMEPRSPSSPHLGPSDCAPANPRGRLQLVPPRQRR
jgi:anti-anti-sigma factor